MRALVASAPSALPEPPAPSRRLLHVDSLRGILLVMMAVNHIPSDLQIATNHIFGFVSAAEGFVFLSGLMAGLVYARRYYKHGASEVHDSAVQRSAGIYVFQVAIYALVMLGLRLLTAWTGTPPAIAPRLMIDHPWSALLSGVVLLQQPSLFDILPMYCAFLLTVPVVIVACSRGQREPVLIASFLLWTLVNLFSPQTPLIHGILNTGSFNLLAWQLLFVVGVVFGHAWASGQRLWPKPRAGLTTVVFAIAALLYAIRHTLVHLPLSGEWLDHITNKNNLAPLRLINAALLFYLVYGIAVYFPRVLAWRPFAFLGQHSMFVFAVHILAAYALQAFPDVFGTNETGRWLGTLAMIVTLFSAAGIHQRWQERELRKPREVRARQPWLPDPKLGHGS